MMNRNLAIRRLWWKELRQLLPLVGLLILVGAALQLLTLLLPSGTRLSWHPSVALLGMPGLFAVGAGALLVGQEKEMRTLDWLRSLPLAAGDLIRTKLLAALAGLLAVWCFSLASGWATGSWDSIREMSGGEPLWILHTVFLMLVGFATAWRFRSSMIALLLVVPLACLPLLFAGLHQSFLDGELNRLALIVFEPKPWLMAAYLGLFAVGFLWLGWRFGLAYLAPQAAPHGTHLAAAPRGGHRLALSYPRTSPAPALLWQFAAQNRAALIGLSCLLGAALAVITFTLTTTVMRHESPGSSLGALAFFALIGGFLSISWFGLLAFQGDTLQGRILFLANRGVSPTLTWITRQALPVAVLIIALLLFIGVEIVLFPEAFRIGAFETLLLIAAVFGVYTNSQWIGQWIRSPIVSAIVAPAVAGSLLAYSIYSLLELGAPWWTIASMITLPLLATFVGMRAWMDGRSGWRFWGWHASLMAVTLLIPCTSILWWTVKYPRMSAAAKAELLSESSQGYYPLQSIPLTDGRSLKSSEIDSPLPTSYEESRKRDMLAFRNRLAEEPQANVDLRSAESWFADAIVLRLRDPQATDQQIVARYREAIDLLRIVLHRFRQVPQLRSQHFADMIEIWLLGEMQAAHAQSRLGPELYDQLWTTLRDQQSRYTARLRALAYSWRAAVEDQDSGSLGGYDLQTTRTMGQVTLKDVWESRRKAGIVSQRLLELLKAPASQRTELRIEIGRLMNLPESLAMSNDSLMHTGSQPMPLYYELKSNVMPGALWHGAWEQEAQQLPRESQEEVQ